MQTVNAIIYLCGSSNSICPQSIVIFHLTLDHRQQPNTSKISSVLKTDSTNPSSRTTNLLQCFLALALELVLAFSEIIERSPERGLY